MPDKPEKIFQIGFNKCGTTSIHEFFRANGMRSVHWNGGRLAQTIFNNLQHGRSLIDGYARYDVFTDMESIVPEKIVLEAYKLFPLFAAEFPEALFILNTRDREAWVKSRLSHRGGALAKMWKSVQHVETDDEITAMWRDDWDAHHERVQAFFAKNPHRFLLFDIEKDSPDKLVAAYPELPLDAALFGHYIPHAKTSRPDRAARPSRTDRSRRRARRLRRETAKRRGEESEPEGPSPQADTST